MNEDWRRLQTWALFPSNETHSCPPAELTAIAKLQYAEINRMEMRKAVPVRFPANNDSVGIELVGECVLDPNLIKPGMNAQQIDALRARHRVGKITNITIAVASKSNNYDPTENCASFALTPRSSEFFFHHAKVVSEASAAHDFDYSSCYAEGEVVFSNGDEGHWSIAHGGTGSLLLRSGKFKGQLIHLY